MATQVERRASSQARLIAAAATMVAEGGFAGASCAQLGERAGMSRGAVNFHFGTKANLLNAAVAKQTSRWGQAITRTVARERPSSVVELLDAHWRAWLAIQGGSRLAMMLIYEAIGPSPHILAQVTAAGDGVTRYIQGQLQSLAEHGLVDAQLETDAAARLLIASLTGLISEIAAGRTQDADAGYQELRETLRCRWTPPPAPGS